MIQDLNLVAQELEKQELQAQGGVSSPQLYTKLLAIYLYQNDLCNAKFLWMRIPPNVKSSHPELGQVWSVGKAMWLRDAPSVYNIIHNTQWSENVAPIMQLLLSSVRERAISLVRQAYSSLSCETLSLLVGLPQSDLIGLAKERGWGVEDGGVILPTPPPPPPTQPASSEDQLHKLTDFVSFLEN